MSQLTFVMQFKGTATPPANPTDPLTIHASANSSSFATVIGETGVSATGEAAYGETATFESEATFTSPSSFTETGTITYGEGGHQLHFSTVGEGTIGPSTEPTLQSGAVLWQIESGTGQFEGATGFITSNFIVDAQGSVIDNQLAVVFLARR
jgi:hypothetical protein